MNSSARQRIWIVRSGAILVIVAACLAAYLPALQAGYIWDDDFYVTNNQLLSAPDGLWRIWFTRDSPSQYFPMVYTTFRFEYALWGLKPFGYHLTNVILHVVNALLLWWLLSLLSISGSWLAAAIFALHPVHTESVAWISERKNVLSLLFYLSSALAYLRYALGPRIKTGQDKSERLYMLSYILFLCALSSKTVTCTLPIVLLVVLWWKYGRVSREDVRDLMRFFILSIAWGLFTIWWEHGHQGTSRINLGINPIERTLIASRALWFYLGKLIWPVNLTFSYPQWKINASNPLQYSWLLACLIAAWGLWHWRNKLGRGPIAAILFFVITLSPILGFISLYTFLYSYVADHYQYVASIGPITLIVAAGCLIRDRIGRWKNAVTMPIAVLVLATLGTLTWHQSHIYKDLETLWRDTIRKNPDSFVAHSNLGDIVFERNELDETAVHFSKALSLKPDDAQALNNMGALSGRQGNFDQAVTYLTKALQVRPDYAKAHTNLGDMLERQGKLDQAVEHYRTAIQINPDNFEAMAVLARLLAVSKDNKIRNPDQAIVLAEKACVLTGRKQPEFLYVLAVSYAAAGRTAEAMATANEAVDMAQAANKQQLVREIKTWLQLQVYPK